MGGWRSLRRRSLCVHRTVGIVLAAFVLFQSVSGLMLVFGDQLDAWLRPGLYRHGSGDVGATAVLRQVRAARPRATVGALTTPAVTGGVYAVVVGRAVAFVDPATARINGWRDPKKGFVASVRRLHERPWEGQILGVDAAHALAVLGIGWLVLVASGLGTALRRPAGRHRRRLRISLPAGRQDVAVAHRAVGLVVALPLVVVVATGIRLAIPDPVDRGWATLTGSGLRRADRPPPGVATASRDRGGQPLDADGVVSALHRIRPGAVVARVAMPLPGNRSAPVAASLTVGWDPARGPRGRGGNLAVLLDQYDGHPLWLGRASAVPVLRRVVTQWSLPLHAGTAAGGTSFSTPLRLVWLGLALAGGGLATSGPFLRLARRPIPTRARQRERIAKRHRRRAQRRLARRRQIHAPRRRTPAPSRPRSPTS
jgi:uncharacterized iron-regulated membrane protein